MNRKEKSPCDKCKYENDCTIYAQPRFDYIECKKYKEYRNKQVTEKRRKKIKELRDHDQSLY